MTNNAAGGLIAYVTSVVLSGGRVTAADPYCAPSPTQIDYEGWQQ